MAKKKNPENPEDQVKRFEAEVQKLIDAGELNPTEAESRFNQAIEKIAQDNRAIQSSDLSDIPASHAKDPNDNFNN